MDEGRYKSLILQLQRDAIPREWQRVAEGRSSPRQARRRTADRVDESTLEHLEHTLAPLPTDVRGRIIDALVETHSSHTPRAPYRQRRPWRWIAATAAAAGLALALSPKPSLEGEHADPAPRAELADYSIELRGATQTLRGRDSASDVPRYRLDGIFELIVAPSEWTSEVPELRLFMFGPDGGTVIECEPQRDADGRIRVSGPVHELLGTRPGHWTLAVVLGHDLSSADPADYEPGRSAQTAVVRHFDIIIEPDDLRVEVDGCERRAAMPCVARPRGALHVWVAHPAAASAVITLGGRALPAETYRAPGQRGTGFRVEVDDVGGDLSVALHESLSVRPYVLPVSVWPIDRDPDRDAIRAIDLLHERAYAAQMDERWEEAATLRRNAMQRALSHGLTSRAVQAGMAAAFVLSRNVGDEVAASAVLADLRVIVPPDTTESSELDYYEGVVAMTDGRLSEAADAYLRASRAAIRHDDRQLAIEALPMFANTLAELGRYDQARYWAHQAARISENAHPCDLAANLVNAAWVDFLLRLQGRPHDDPVPPMKRAAQLYSSDGSCADARHLTSTRVSLAVVLTEDQQSSEVAALLGALDGAALDPRERLWLADVQLAHRLAMRGNVEDALQALEAATDELRTPEARWRYHWRRGRVMWAQGRALDALNSYRAAEGVLDESADLAALPGFGLDLFFSQGSSSARELIVALTELGELEEARCVARRSHRRRLKTLVAQASLSMGQVHSITRPRARTGDSDAPSEPRTLLAVRTDLSSDPCTGTHHPEDGTLELLIHPAEEQWLVFSTDASGTTASFLDASALEQDRDALGRALLEPLSERLTVARRVHVIAAGASARLDVHALTWHGAPLVAKVPVEYSLDLPVIARARGRSAMIVTDPTRTLPAAVMAELEAVQTSLRMDGAWSVDVMSDTTVDPSTILARLPDVTLFHYAGHGGRTDAWEHSQGPRLMSTGSGLLLGNDARLNALDVLTLPQAPDRVVLSGCETQQVDDPLELGLAAAFLIAGADAVVATTRPIDDRVAARVSAALYVAMDDSFDLVERLARAQRMLSFVEIEDSGWQSFRAWVR